MKPPRNPGEKREWRKQMAGNFAGTEYAIESVLGETRSKYLQEWVSALIFYNARSVREIKFLYSYFSDARSSVEDRYGKNTRTTSDKA